jgi:hypothetical protein
MKLSMQFSPPSCHFILPRTKHSQLLGHQMRIYTTEHYLKKKKTNFVAVVRKRPTLVGEVSANLC